MSPADLVIPGVTGFCIGLSLWHCNRLHAVICAADQLRVLTEEVQHCRRKESALMASSEDASESGQAPTASRKSVNAMKARFEALAVGK